MPTIPVETNRWMDLLERVSVLSGDPTNPEIDHRSRMQAKTHYAVGLMKAYPGVFPVTQGIVERALETPTDGIQLNVDWDAMSDRCCIVGLGLYQTLRLAVHAPKHASLENGMRLAEPILKIAGIPASRATRMAAWSSHRSISHFWAARFHDDAFDKIADLLAFRYPDNWAETMSDKMPITATDFQRWMSDPEKFFSTLDQFVDQDAPRFVATAERMRELAERHYAPTQKAHGHSLLPKGLAWSVPSSFALPHVQVEFHQLSDQERQILELDD